MNATSANYIVASALLAGMPFFVFFGALSDRIGRKRMYMIGSIFVGTFGFIYFALLDTKVPSLMFLAIALSLLPAMTCYGPQAALIAESFSPRLRYSGASLSLTLATIVGGAIAPFIATALFSLTGTSSLVTAYLVVFSVISWLCLLRLHETSRQNLSTISRSHS